MNSAFTVRQLSIAASKASLSVNRKSRLSHHMPRSNRLLIQIATNPLMPIFSCFETQVCIPGKLGFRGESCSLYVSGLKASVVFNQFEILRETVERFVGHGV